MLRLKLIIFMGIIRENKISLYAQLGKLQHYFPNSTTYVDKCKMQFTWKTTLCPSELSSSYEIKLVYKFGKNPDVFVVSPKPLALAEGKSKLPHVYDHDKQWLCLYHKPSREWTPNMMIADTIVPWISEWLLHYEYWVVTGIWHGGGIH